MDKLKVGDRVKVLKYWEGEGIIEQVYSNGEGYRVRMVTGPQSPHSGGFELNEVEPVHVMKILKIKRSGNGTGLKIYGKLLSTSGETYNFAYIRRPNFRGWICSCENFFFTMFKKNPNCKHLKFVRAQVGRYGTKAQA